MYRPQAQQPNGHHHQQGPARSSEGHAEETIGAGQPGHANKLADKEVDHGPHQQGGDEKNGAAGNDACRWRLDIAFKILRKGAAEHPGDRTGNDPDEQDKASLTKPRLRLISEEMAMIAMIAQSTQVNATVLPADV